MPAFQSSEDLAEFFKWFYGEELPGLQPERFYTLAQELHQVADSLDDASLEFIDAVRTIRSGVMGQAEEAFVESSEDVAESLGLAPEYVRTMAQMMHQFSALFNYVIITVMAITALLLFELIVALKLFWINPAVLLEWLAKAPAIRQGLFKLFMQLAAKASLTAAFNILYELLVDVFAQLMNRSKKYQRGWNNKNTGDAAASGALESLVGGLFGLGGSGLRRLGRDTNVGGKSITSHLPGGKGGKALGAGAGLAGNAGEEVATEVIVGGIMNGQIDTNILAPTAVSSILNNLTFGGIGAGRDALAGGGTKDDGPPKTSSTPPPATTPPTNPDLDPVPAYEPPPPGYELPPPAYSEADPGAGAGAGAGTGVGAGAVGAGTGGTGPGGPGSAGAGTGGTGTGGTGTGTAGTGTVGAGTGGTGTVGAGTGGTGTGGAGTGGGTGTSGTGTVGAGTGGTGTGGTGTVGAGTAGAGGAGTGGTGTAGTGTTGAGTGGPGTTTRVETSDGSTDTPTTGGTVPPGAGTPHTPAGTEVGPLAGVPPVVPVGPQPGMPPVMQAGSQPGMPPATQVGPQSGTTVGPQPGGPSGSQVGTQVGPQLGTAGGPQPGSQAAVQAGPQPGSQTGSGVDSPAAGRPVSGPMTVSGVPGASSAAVADVVRTPGATQSPSAGVSVPARMTVPRRSAGLLDASTVRAGSSGKSSYTSAGRVRGVLARVRSERDGASAEQGPDESSAVARQLGGDWRSGALGDLERLRPGSVTAVWTQNTQKSRREPVRFVLVERLEDGRFVQVETVRKKAAVRTEFDLSGWRGPGDPPAVFATKFVVFTDTNELGQLPIRPADGVSPVVMPAGTRATPEPVVAPVTNLPTAGTPQRQAAPGVVGQGAVRRAAGVPGTGSGASVGGDGTGTQPGRGPQPTAHRRSGSRQSDVRRADVRRADARARSDFGHLPYARGPHPMDMPATPGDASVGRASGDGLFAKKIHRNPSDSEVGRAYPWLKKVNPRNVWWRPDRKVDAVFETNCVVAAIATDMSLQAGRGHKASGTTALPLGDLLNYQRQQLGLADDADAVRYRVSHIGSIREAMKSAVVPAKHARWGRWPTPRGLVVVQTTAPAGTAHVFNVSRRADGTVYFLDGQTGRAARLPKGDYTIDFLPLTANIPQPRGSARVLDLRQRTQFVGGLQADTQGLVQPWLDARVNNPFEPIRNPFLRHQVDAARGAVAAVNNLDPAADTGLWWAQLDNVRDRLASLRDAMPGGGPTSHPDAALTDLMARVDDALALAAAERGSFRHVTAEEPSTVEVAGVSGAGGPVTEPNPPAVSLGDATSTSRRPATEPADLPEPGPSVVEQHPLSPTPARPAPADQAPATPATDSVTPAADSVTPATESVTPAADSVTPAADPAVPTADDAVIAGGWKRSRPGRFEAGSTKSRWRHAPSEAEREQLRVLSAELQGVSNGAQRPHKELVGAAGRLRDAGALRDLHGGAHRGEVVLRDLARRDVPTGVAEQLMLHVRSTTGTSEVLGSVDRAVRSFVAQPGPAQPGILQVGELQDGVLSVGAPPEGSQKVIAADIQRIPVRVVDPGEWDLPTHTSVEVVSVDGEPELRVRGDASEASIAIGVAGELTRWAYQRTFPQTSPEDLRARSLLAQHEAVRRLYFQGRRFGLRRAKRWVKTSTGWLTGAGRVVRGEWSRIDTQLRQLPIGTQDQRDQQGQQGQQGQRRPAGLSAEVRQQVDAVVGRREGIRVQGPLSDKPPLVEHVVRRGWATATVLQTATAGVLADRAPGLIANSAVSATVFNATQAYSDGAAANIAAGGGPPKATLVAPKAGPAGRYSAPGFGLPTPQLTKRFPAASTSSTAALLMTGGLTGNWEIGAAALGMQAGQSLVAGAGSDWVFDRPEAEAKGRFDHYRKHTPDHRRNMWAEMAYHHTREMYERWVEARRRDVPDDLDGTSRQQLTDLAAELDAMDKSIEAEVNNKIGDLHTRRSLAKRFLETFRPSSPASQSYDLIDRGVPDGRPQVWHNATRVGVQHAGAQVPSVTLAHVLGNAVGLADTSIIGAALRGIGYGAGWSLAKDIEFRDAVALAAWDARYQLRETSRLLRAMAEGRTDVELLPMPDATQRPNWRRLSETAALVRHQKEINRGIGRPKEAWWFHQLSYKHIPAMVGQSVGYGVAAGVGFLATGPVVPALIATGVAAQAATAAGETFVRVNEPLYRQVVRQRAAQEQVNRLPWTTDEFVDNITQYGTRAIAENKKIVPVTIPTPDRSRNIVYRFGDASQSYLIGLGRSATVGVRRLGSRIADIGHTGEPLRMLTRRAEPVDGQPRDGDGRPPAIVRPTATDRAAVTRLNEILTDLDASTNPRNTAREDLDPDRLRAELAVLLDELGLRTEQPGSAARWQAVVDNLRTHHARDAVGNTHLDELRGIRLNDQDTATAAPRDAIIKQRATQREQLWSAIGQVEQPPTRNRIWYDVLADDRLHVRVEGSVSSTITVTADASVPHASITHRPDDGGTKDRTPYTLTVNPTVLADPNKLAHVLTEATSSLRHNPPGLRQRLTHYWSFTAPINPPSTTAPATPSAPARPRRLTKRNPRHLTTFGRRQGRTTDAQTRSGRGALPHATESHEMTSPTDWGRGQVGHGWLHSGFTKKINGNPSAADVRSAYPWLPKVNPERDQADVFATNCVITAIATDISVREGVPHQASGTTPLPAQDLLNYQRQQLAIEEDAEGRIYRVRDIASVRDALSSATEGPARGFVVVRKSPKETAHVFNVVRDANGSVYFLDGQSGRPARLPSGNRLTVDFLPLTANIARPAGSRALTGDWLTFDVGVRGQRGDSSPPSSRPAASAVGHRMRNADDALELMAERVRPLQEYLQQVGADVTRPEVDLVLMASGDRVWAEVRVPGREQPVSFGLDPSGSSLLDPSSRVLATIRVSPAQLMDAVLFSFENSDLWMSSLLEGNSEFVRRFAKASVGHRITDASMDASVPEFVAAMTQHSSRTWSDAANPVTSLDGSDTTRLAAARGSLASSGERGSAALSWARHQVALDHQRPVVGQGQLTTDSQRAQFGLLDSFAVLVAAEYVANGESAAAQVSQRLGRNYGTLRNFTLLPPPRGEFAFEGSRSQDWVEKFIELARPLREHVEREIDNPADDIELVLLAAPSRMMADDVPFSPGHAVVAIRLPNGAQAALGFYPNEGFFGAKGAIHDDGRYVSARHARVLGTYRINAQQLRDAYLFAAEGSDANYHLLNSNCVVFATSLVGAALGRPVVDASVTTPDALIAALSPDSASDWVDSSTSSQVRLRRPHGEQLVSSRAYLDLLGRHTGAYGDAIAWARFQVAIDHQRPLVTRNPTDRQISQFALIDLFTTLVAAEFHANGEDAARALSRELGYAYGTLRHPNLSDSAVGHVIGADRRQTPPVGPDPIQGSDDASEVIFDAGDAFESEVEHHSSGPSDASGSRPSSLSSGAGVAVPPPDAPLRDAAFVAEVHTHLRRLKYLGTVDAQTVSNHARTVESQLSGRRVQSEVAEKTAIHILTGRIPRLLGGTPQASGSGQSSSGTTPPGPDSDSDQSDDAVVRVELRVAEGRLVVPADAEDALIRPVRRLAEQMWRDRDEQEAAPTLHYYYHPSTQEPGRTTHSQVVERWIVQEVQRQIEDLALSSGELDPGVDARDVAAALSEDVFGVSHADPDVPVGPVFVDFSAVSSPSETDDDVPMSDSSDDAEMDYPSAPSAGTLVQFETGNSAGGSSPLPTMASADALASRVRPLVEYAWRHRLRGGQLTLEITYHRSGVGEHPAGEPAHGGPQIDESGLARTAQQWIQAQGERRLQELASSSGIAYSEEDGRQFVQGSLIVRLRPDPAMPAGSVLAEFDDVDVLTALADAAETSADDADEALVRWPDWDADASSTAPGDAGAAGLAGSSTDEARSVPGKAASIPPLRRVGSRVWVVPPPFETEGQRAFVAPDGVPDDVILVGAAVREQPGGAVLLGSHANGGSLTAERLLDQLANRDVFQLTADDDAHPSTPGLRVLVLMLHGPEAAVERFGRRLHAEIVDRQFWGQPTPGGLVIGSYVGPLVVWRPYLDHGPGEPTVSPRHSVMMASDTAVDVPSLLRRRLEGEGVGFSDLTLASLVQARLGWDSVWDSPPPPSYELAGSSAAPTSVLAEVRVPLPAGLPGSAVLGEVRGWLRDGRVLPVVPADGRTVSVRVGPGLVAPVYRIGATADHPSQDVFVLHATGEGAQRDGHLRAVPVWVNQFDDGLVIVRTSTADLGLDYLAPSVEDRLVVEPGELSADGARIRNAAPRDSRDATWLTADEYRRRLVGGTAERPPIVVLIRPFRSARGARLARFVTDLSRNAVVLTSYREWQDWTRDRNGDTVEPGWRHWWTLWRPVVGPVRGDAPDNLPTMVHRAAREESPDFDSALNAFVLRTVEPPDVAVARRAFFEGARPTVSVVTVRLEVDAGQVEQWLRTSPRAAVVPSFAARDSHFPPERLSSQFSGVSITIPVRYVAVPPGRPGLYVLDTAALAHDLISIAPAAGERSRYIVTVRGDEPPAYEVGVPDGTDTPAHPISDAVSESLPPVAFDERSMADDLWRIGRSLASLGASPGALQATVTTASLADLQSLAAGAVTMVLTTPSDGEGRLYLVVREDHGRIYLIDGDVPADSPDRLVDITDVVDDAQPPPAILADGLALNLDRHRLRQFDIAGQAVRTRDLQDGLDRDEFVNDLRSGLAVPAGVVASQDRRNHLARVASATRWWLGTRSGDRLDGLFTAVRGVEARLGLGGPDGSSLLDLQDIADVLVGVHEAAVATGRTLTGRGLDRIDMALRALDDLSNELRHVPQSPDVEEHLRQARHFAQALSSQLESVRGRRGMPEASDVQQRADVPEGIPDAEFVRQVNRHLASLRHPPVGPARIAAARAAVRSARPGPMPEHQLAYWAAQHIKFGHLPGLPGGSRRADAEEHRSDLGGDAAGPGPVARSAPASSIPSAAQSDDGTADLSREVASVDGPAVYLTMRVGEFGDPIEGLRVQLPATRAYRAEAELTAGDDNIALVVHPLAPLPEGTGPVSLDPRASYEIHSAKWDDDAGLVRVELLEVTRSAPDERANRPTEMPWMPLRADGPMSVAQARVPQDADLVTAAQATRLRWQGWRLVPSVFLVEDDLNSVLNAAGVQDVGDHREFVRSRFADIGLWPTDIGLPADADLAEVLRGPAAEDVVPVLISIAHSMAVVVVRPDGSLIRFGESADPDTPTVVLVQTPRGLRPALLDTMVAAAEPAFRKLRAEMADPELVEDAFDLSRDTVTSVNGHLADLQRKPVSRARIARARRVVARNAGALDDDVLSRRIAVDIYRDDATRIPPESDLEPGAVGEGTLRAIRNWVTTATSDLVLDSLWPGGPDENGSHLTVELAGTDLNLPVRTIRTANGEELALRTRGEWLEAVLHRELNLHLTRWAQRKGSALAPRVRVRVTHESSARGEPAGLMVRLSGWEPVFFEVPPFSTPRARSGGALPPRAAATVQTVADVMAAAAVRNFQAAKGDAVRDSLVTFSGLGASSDDSDDSARTDVDAMVAEFSRILPRSVDAQFRRRGRGDYSEAEFEVVLASIGVETAVLPSESEKFTRINVWSSMPRTPDERTSTPVTTEVRPWQGDPPPEVLTSVRKVVGEVAQLAVRAHAQTGATAGAEPDALSRSEVIVIGQYQPGAQLAVLSSARRLQQLFRQELAAAVRETLGAESTPAVTDPSPADVEAVVRTVRFDVEGRRAPVGSVEQPPLLLKVTPPPLPPPIRDESAPVQDYLSTWNRSRVRVLDDDGWWRAGRPERPGHAPLSPARGVDDIADSLPPESFRTVRPEVVEVTDPIGQRRMLGRASAQTAYDVARVEVSDHGAKGGPVRTTEVRVFRLRLFLHPGEGVTQQDVADLKWHAQRAVRQMNELLRLPAGPSDPSTPEIAGDQFHLQVQFTRRSSDALQVIHVPLRMQDDAVANSATWPVTLLERRSWMDADTAQQALDATIQSTLLHEMLHLVGLSDEYASWRNLGAGANEVRLFAVAVPGRPAWSDPDRPALERMPRRTDDPGLMGSEGPSDDPRSPIAVRYLTQMWLAQENEGIAPLTRVSRSGGVIRSIEPATPDGTTFVREDVVNEVRTEWAAAGDSAAADRAAYLKHLEAALAWWPETGSGRHLERLISTVRGIEKVPGLGSSEDQPSLLDAKGIATVLVGMHEAAGAAGSTVAGQRVNAARQALERLSQRLNGLQSTSLDVTALIEHAQRLTRDLSSQLRPDRAAASAQEPSSPQVTGTSTGHSPSRPTGTVDTTAETQHPPRRTAGEHARDQALPRQVVNGVVVDADLIAEVRARLPHDGRDRDLTVQRLSDIVRTVLADRPGLPNRPRRAVAAWIVDHVEHGEVPGLFGGAPHRRAASDAASPPTAPHGANPPVAGPSGVSGAAPSIPPPNPQGGTRFMAWRAKGFALIIDQETGGGAVSLDEESGATAPPRSIPLSPSEASVLKELMIAAAAPTGMDGAENHVKHEDVEKIVGEWRRRDGSTQDAFTTMFFLRKKLESLPHGRPWIMATHHLGWRLAAASEVVEDHRTGLRLTFGRDNYVVANDPTGSAEPHSTRLVRQEAVVLAMLMAASSAKGLVSVRAIDAAILTASLNAEVTPAKRHRVLTQLRRALESAGDFQIEHYGGRYELRSGDAPLAGRHFVPAKFGAAYGDAASTAPVAPGSFVTPVASAGDAADSVHTNDAAGPVAAQNPVVPVEGDGRTRLGRARVAISGSGLKVGGTTVEGALVHVPVDSAGANRETFLNWGELQTYSRLTRFMGARFTPATLMDMMVGTPGLPTVPTEHDVVGWLRLLQRKLGSEWVLTDGKDWWGERPSLPAPAATGSPSGPVAARGADISSGVAAPSDDAPSGRADPLPHGGTGDDTPSMTVDEIVAFVDQLPRTDDDVPMSGADSIGHPQVSPDLPGAIARPEARPQSFTRGGPLVTDGTPRVSGPLPGSSSGTGVADRSGSVGIRTVAVPRDGWCVLNSTVISAPGRFAELLRRPDPTEQGRRVAADDERAAVWLSNVAEHHHEPGVAEGASTDPELTGVVKAIAARLARMIRDPRAFNLDPAFTDGPIRQAQMWASEGVITPVGLADAVDRWDTEWGGPYGEAFLPLVANALGTPILIHFTEADEAGEGELNGDREHMADPPQPPIHVRRTDPDHWDARVTGVAPQQSRPSIAAFGISLTIDPRTGEGTVTHDKSTGRAPATTVDGGAAVGESTGSAPGRRRVLLNSLQAKALELLIRETSAGRSIPHPVLAAALEEPVGPAAARRSREGRKNVVHSALTGLKDKLGSMAHPRVEVSYLGVKGYKLTAAPLPGEKTARRADAWRLMNAMDLQGRSLITPDLYSVALSPDEFLMLRFLVGVKGAPRTPRQIMNESIEVLGGGGTGFAQEWKVNDWLVGLQRRLGSERIRTDGARWWIENPSGRAPAPAGPSTAPIIAGGMDVLSRIAVPDDGLTDPAEGSPARVGESGRDGVAPHVGDDERSSSDTDSLFDEPVGDEPAGAADLVPHEGVETPNVPRVDSSDVPPPVETFPDVTGDLAEGLDEISAFLNELEQTVPMPDADFTGYPQEWPDLPEPVGWPLAQSDPFTTSDAYPDQWYPNLESNYDPYLGDLPQMLAQDVYGLFPVYPYPGPDSLTDGIADDRQPDDDRDHR